MTPLGDVGPLAWGITLLYLVAAWRCWRADGSGGLRDWRVLAVLLLALGINKQLDAQTLLIEGLRWVARAGGWYRERRWLQAAALAVGGLACVALLTILIVQWRRRGDAALGLAGGGLVLLVAFVGLRAARILHGPRRLLLPSAWLRDWLEPIALLLILVAAEWAIRCAPSRPAPRAGARSAPTDRW